MYDYVLTVLPSVRRPFPKHRITLQHAIAAVFTVCFIRRPSNLLSPESGRPSVRTRPPTGAILARTGSGVQTPSTILSRPSLARQSPPPTSTSANCNDECLLTLLSDVSRKSALSALEWAQALFGRVNDHANKRDAKDLHETIEDLSQELPAEVDICDLDETMDSDK